MTKEQVERLNLGLQVIDDQVCLTVESGIMWVNNNTTLSYDPNNDDSLATIPANVKMFLIKFCDVMGLSLGVTSESIGPLSQSFGGDISSLLWAAAAELIGAEYLVSVRIVPATKRW